MMKTPAIMNGYYGNAEATNKIIKDGWIYSGDVVTKDEQGYYYMVVRIRLCFEVI